MCCRVSPYSGASRCPSVGSRKRPSPEHSSLIPDNMEDTIMNLESRNDFALSRWALVLAIVPLAASRPATARDHGIPTSAEPCEVVQRAGLPGQAPALFDPERILVRFRSGTSRAARESAHDATKGRRLLKEYHAVTGLQVVQVLPGDVPAALADYQANPNVLYAEPDYFVYATGIPNDPYFDLLWGLHNTGQVVGSPGTAGADIRAVPAWDFWIGDPDFRIAVLDTGIDYTHPDLQANIWTNPGEIPGNEVDDDGNGYVDDVHGYDFVHSDGDPMDDSGHGTHVAGTIGAVGNDGFGVVGVNWCCRIVGLKFLGASG